MTTHNSHPLQVSIWQNVFDPKTIWIRRDNDANIYEISPTGTLKICYRGKYPTLIPIKELAISMEVIREHLHIG